MDEHEDEEQGSGTRPAAEGVRIIRAEEAQAALDAGSAAGRRSEDELRFGDVPPAPAGPRLPHRFPLPDTVDPADVPRRPVAAPMVAAPIRADDRAHGARALRGASPSDDHVDAPPSPGPAVTPLSERPQPPSAPGQVGTSVSESAPSGRPSSESADPTGAYDVTAQHPAIDVEPPPRLSPASADVAAPLSPDIDPLAWPSVPGPSWGLSAAPPAGNASAVASPPPASPTPANRPAASPPPANSAPASPPPANPLIASLPAATAPPERLPGAPSAAGSSPVVRAAATLPPTPLGPPPDLTPPEEGITMSGGGSTDLPHWTDPPTGEVPRILPESATPNGDDLAAWQALGARGMRWRDDGDDWNDAEELGALGGDETRVGALDTSRTDHSDLYSFDEEFERLEEERSGSHGAVAIDEFDDPLEPEPERISSSVRTGPPARGERPGGHARPPRPRPAPRRPGAPGGPGGGRDLGPALVVGAGLVVLLGICYAIGPKALMVLSAAVVLAAAIEAFGMVWRSGFRPATLLGLTGSVGVVAAAYWRGEPAIPLVTVLVFGATMLWYVLRIVDGRPLVNVAVTTMTFVWVGVSGSFASLLLRAPHGGHLFLGAVIPTVVADIAAYLIGSRFGSHLLAPELSPGKTWEGIAAGAAGAIVAGVIIGNRLGPWGGVKHGFELGLVVAVVAPVGDLFESMIKRDLSVKDSGTALPGHGGILDRFDSMLLVLPAVYFLATLFNIIR